MKNFKLFILTLLSISLFTFAADAQTKKKKAVKKPRPTVKKTVKPPITTMPTEEPRAEDYKIIAAGDNATIDEPFLFVARDEKTYALLQKSVENLPDASAVDFTKEVVVAAFAGTKPTPGWEVLFRKVSDRAAIDIAEPRKDRMYAQVLTTPYKIAVVPVENEKPLALEATATWTNKMTKYRVGKATFTYSGGFAPRQRLFGAEGAIGVASRGDLVTMTFDLTAKGDNSMKLMETVSGSLTEGKIELARLDAGTFSEGPKPSVNVTGTMSENKLALRFEPNPGNGSDGFQLRGEIEAVKLK